MFESRESLALGLNKFLLGFKFEINLICLIYDVQFLQGFLVFIYFKHLVPLFHFELPYQLLPPHLDLDLLPGLENRVLNLFKLQFHLFVPVLLSQLSHLFM